VTTKVEDALATIDILWARVGRERERDSGTDAVSNASTASDKNAGGDLAIPRLHSRCVRRVPRRWNIQSKLVR